MASMIHVQIVDRVGPVDWYLLDLNLTCAGFYSEFRRTADLRVFDIDL